MRTEKKWVIGGLAAACLTSAVPAIGSPIQWGTPQNITSNPANDLNSQGTNVQAYSFGGDTYTTAGSTGINVSGVTFVPWTNTTNSSLITSGNGYGSYGPGTPMQGTAYFDVLTYGVYNSSTSGQTLTLTNLLPGNTYAVQIWENDNHGYNGASRTFTVSDASSGGDQATLLGDASFATPTTPYYGQWVIGTFSASSTTQTLYFSGNADTNINALALNLVPEPASVSLIALAVPGMLMRRRRRV